MIVCTFICLHCQRQTVAEWYLNGREVIISRGWEHCSQGKRHKLLLILPFSIGSQVYKYWADSQLLWAFRSKGHLTWFTNCQSEWEYQLGREIYKVKSLYSSTTTVDQREKMGKSRAPVLVQGSCSSRPACGRRTWGSEIPLRENKKTEDESCREVVRQRSERSSSWEPQRVVKRQFPSNWYHLLSLYIAFQLPKGTLNPNWAPAQGEGVPHVLCSIYRRESAFTKCFDSS